MTEVQTERSRWFIRLAFFTALLTFALIVIGAVVRVSDSGLGCGNDWPLCNGQIFPPLNDTTAWIEWSHRLVAMSIGVFGIGMLITVLRSQRANRLAVGATIVAAVLYAVQSGLGRSVVKAELDPTLVTIHLGTAMLLFASLLGAGVAVSYRPMQHYKTDRVTTLVYVTTALAFVIILIGGLVRGSGATLACTDWPLCNGQILPIQHGQLAVIHMAHRFVVIALGVSLLVLVWQINQNRQDVRQRRLAALTFAIYLSQAGVGALVVFSAASPIWAAAHVGLAGLTWGLLIILCIAEWLNSHESTSEVIGTHGTLNPTKST
jgi:heme A synthase